MTVEFSPTVQEGNGPSSNTGQNLEAAGVPRRSLRKRGTKLASPAVAVRGGALIDYLSVTLPDAEYLQAEYGGEDFARNLVKIVFGQVFEGVTEFAKKGFQGYSHSACIFAGDGLVVGHVAVGGNGDTAHITISGEGCARITNWERVQSGIAAAGGRITRVDLAYDDYDGALYTLDELNDLARARCIRSSGAGRPPKTRFLDDHGHGTGRTLYAGQKGHKELCCYEKGRKNGDPNSRWVRVEVRMWAKHVDFPLTILTHPIGYLRASYNICERIANDACDRIRTTAKAVETSAVALVRWARTQLGATTRLLRKVLGEEFDSFMAENIDRDARPGRFRSFSEAALMTHLRQGLNRACSSDPLCAVPV